MSKCIHLFPNGSVEVGTGKPGYRWANAYSAATANGFTQPLTRRHWKQIADRDGQRCKFYDSKEDARAALAAEGGAA